ncbi:hypothetical protein G6F66_010395 [Rhizopus arrhizus]|nr:hypothetical protein G6F66_010395 [Rhizopus arrhizus]
MEVDNEMFLIENVTNFDIYTLFLEIKVAFYQALCLAEICNILRRHYRITPVLAFLDIKSAYDTVDRRQVWHMLEKTAPAALISLLRNVFDEVQIEVLLNNATSTRFSPVTGVLQGSILSPFLYSTYINELPRLLRLQPITADISPTEFILQLNYLLYADDMVLIAAKADMPSLLKSCEDHSYELGYRWNPTIGVHPKGFSPLLGTRFYSHIVRAQLEYDLAITKITTFLSKQLEDAQNVCLRRIFGGSHTSSIAVMLHMSKLPTMSPIWKRCLPDPETLDRRSLKSIQRDYRQGNLDNKRSTHASVLLQHCLPTISLDPVLWLLMSKSERCRCIRWRLGWLPGGRYKACLRHPGQPFTKAHTIHCLQMHRRLMMPETISDPLSFLLNMLPTKKPRSPNTTLSWTIRWPTICRILYELDYLYHAKIPPTPPTHLGQRLLEWLPSFPSH